MKNLTEMELREIQGGFSAWVAVGIGVAITVIAGIIDGFTRPLNCHK